MNKHQAIYAVAPTVVTIRGDEAFDADGNPVAYDEAAVQAYIDANAYKEQRATAYPPMTDYLDGVVKGDQAQIDAYIAACLAVKLENPKP
jgi:hypothetical protein